MRAQFVNVLRALRLIGLARRAHRLWWNARHHLTWAVKSRIQIGHRPLVPADAFSTCLRDAVRLMRHESGDAPVGAHLEFGVSRGTSMACASRVYADEGLDDVRLYGFDSFQGMPPHASKEGWTPGAYRSTRRATERYLRAHGADLSRITLVEGWFEETLTQEMWRELRIGRAGVIMIDCDIFSATKQALTFCVPLIGDHVVVIFDDWGVQGAEGQRGEREAFEWFLDAYPSFRATPIPSTYAPGARVFLLTREKVREQQRPAAADALLVH